MEIPRTGNVTEAMDQTPVNPLLVDTATGEVNKREQMELGSPINKVRKVTTPQESTPSTIGEFSQTEKEKFIDLTMLDDSSDKEMLDDTGVGQMVRVKQEFTEELDDDVVFTGLTNHDSDEEFPSHMICCDSDDSNYDDDDEHDPEQIEMQHSYEQQERNRNRAK